MNFKKLAARAGLTVVLSMLCLVVFAQERQVTGTIKDTSGETMIGVNVLVKGTTNGAITDIDGNFTLSGVKNTDVLLISYIGYLTQNISVGSQSVFNIVLKDDTQALEEVVVVGYGVQRKSDVTGSVGSVDNSSLVGKGATTAMESLQGQIAGVDITQSSSRVGESFTIQIRGKSSIQGGNPLYVVDGIITDDINFLNPSDIEKIDILKDASSTAIYGSRATNGVVMVTTKQARISGDQRVSVTYDGFFGYKKVANMPEFMDDVEWMDFRYMKYVTPVKNGQITDGRLPLEMTAGNLASVWNDKGSDLSLKMRDQFLRRDFTDWKDLVLEDGTQQNHFINIAGSTQKTAYRVGAGYQQEDGIMGDDYRRFNLKVCVDSKINRYVTVGANANLSAMDFNLGSKRAVQEAFRVNGYWLPYNTETGELNYQPGKDLRPGQASSLTFPAGFSSSVSPLMDAENSKDETKAYRVLANAYLQIQPIKEVIFKTTLSPSLYTRRKGEYYGGLSSERASTYNASTKPEGDPLATVTKTERFSYTWDTQVNYIKTIGDHDFNVMGLISVYDTRKEEYKFSSSGVLPGTDWYNMGSGSNILNPGSGFDRETMLSYALRLNYSYKGKYLLTASTRWDGSSKYQSNERWGIFPSAALAWRVSEESFIKDNADWISNLKLRVSYGATGNNAAVGSYDTQALASRLYYYGYNSVIAKGYGPNGIVNEALTWEKTNEVNIGLDFGFLDGRISGTIDWYNKVSRDLLMKRKLLIEQGSEAGIMWDNIGKVRNRGIEALVKVIPVRTKDWYWDVTVSFAKNKNEILELQYGKQDMRGDRWFIGQPIDVIYDLNMTGICTQAFANEVITVDGKTGSRSEIYGWYEGCMTFEDVNQDGKIDDADRKITGQKLPKWTGNLSTSLRYKNWDFSMSINTKQGHKLSSPFMDEFTDYSDRGRNKLKMDFYIPAGAPVFNYTWDGTNTASLTSDAGVVAETTIVGSYPYPFNDVAYNHGGSTGWRTGKNTEFNPNGVVDASYVKIKNITVGYTFPREWLNKIHVQSLRIYANVLNPFTFTDYKGFDPEWADASISEGKGGPSSISYQIGLNVKF